MTDSQTGRVLRGKVTVEKVYFVNMPLTVATPSVPLSVNNDTKAEHERENATAKTEGKGKGA